MEPDYSEGDFVLVQKYFRPKIKDVVVVSNQQKQLILKRIKALREIKGEWYYWVEGDNKDFSKDSRNFGWVQRKDLKGKVFLVLKRNLKVFHKTNS